jgi:malate dehydrogenase (oxaloacetate-decarboxylating)(NADP+)
MARCSVWATSSASAGDEGKAVLFKKFAGVDVFDIEINEKDPVKLVEIIASLSRPRRHQPEDIKAPDCFYVSVSCASV